MTEQRQSTDGELLAAFVERNDQPAFAALIERHGRMVLAVSRGILQDRHAAEDVAQAVFLVMARKAAQLRSAGTCAPWLHRVTHDLAVNALRRRLRQQAREQETGAMDATATPPLPPEQQKLLHEHLRALPDRYRAPLVLCYLEGQPAEQAGCRDGVCTRSGRSKLARTHRVRGCGDMGK